MANSDVFVSTLTEQDLELMAAREAAKQAELRIQEEIVRGAVCHAQTAYLLETTRHEKLLEGLYGFMVALPSSMTVAQIHRALGILRR